MMSMFKSDYMPAPDMWFSGNGINYYYVSQYMATFLTKLAGVPVSVGYNIAMMMLAAMAFALSYSIGNNLMHIFIKDRAKRNWTPSEIDTMRQIGAVSEESGKPFFRPVIAGTLSGLAVAIAGNMHYPFYKFIYPKLQRLHGEDSTYSYWFPDATRYIGYNPDRADKTIHEFPVYSFAIGDLHAHVFNMIFVLTVLALLLAWMQKRKKAMDLVRINDAVPVRPPVLKEVFDPMLVRRFVPHDELLGFPDLLCGLRCDCVVLQPHYPPVPPLGHYSYGLPGSHVPSGRIDCRTAVYAYV